MKGLFKVAVVLCIIAALIGAFLVYKNSQTRKYQVGDVIQFGRYEQDNNLSNGAEEIEWRVLENDGETALVVSVMGLDAKPYHEEYKNITWEDCTLRAWLNNEFYNVAFNENERERIALTEVVNSDKPFFESNDKTKSGNNTDDYVFLLSIAEAETYFVNDDDRILKPTKYAIANGAQTWEANGSGWWWLRSPGLFWKITSMVGTDGVVYGDEGVSVFYGDGSVRPAMRIKLGN